MPAKKPIKKQKTEDLLVFRKMKESPIYFIQVMWKLYPQPIKPEFQNIVYNYIANNQEKLIKPEFFEPFIKNTHITWQQWLILLQVEKSIHGYAPRRISVASGHGIGKSCTMAWLILWFLFCHPLAQIPCTANTGDQLYDVLWKELAKWHSRLPESVQPLYEVQADHIRINDPNIKNSGMQWWARARTANKEKPEAMAGVHSDYVMAVIDEASGVDDKIFEVLEGALTEKDILVVMISNPTRLIGYFYDSHCNENERKNWQTLQFASMDSPIPSDGYAERIAAKYGVESDEYRVRVMGLFPKEDMVDDSGYVPMFLQSDIRQTSNVDMYGHKRLGIDPAGEGKDKTVWVLRDKFKARIILTEKTSTPKTIVQRTLGLMELFQLKAGDIDVDMFGVGGEVVKEFALAGKDVNSLNVGERPNTDDTADEDNKVYSNKRACYYFRLRKWLKQGGELVADPAWTDEAPAIRYRRMAGESKIQVMSKRDMRKAGFHSPDHMDALMLTFSHDDDDLGKVFTVTPGQVKDGRPMAVDTVVRSDNFSEYNII
jgi:hypothetical protein